MELVELLRRYKGALVRLEFTDGEVIDGCGLRLTNEVEGVATPDGCMAIRSGASPSPHRGAHRRDWRRSSRSLNRETR
jgi:hypothetical protein